MDQKRLQEAILSEQRLLEARKLFHQSQDLLRRLIQEKDERTKRFFENAQRYWNLLIVAITELTFYDALRYREGHYGATPNVFIPSNLTTNQLLRMHLL